MGLISFFVPGKPVPKERPRIGKGRSAYTPPRTTNYENQVRACAAQALGRRKPLEGPVAVYMDIYEDGVWVFVFPVERSKGSSRGDIDNIVKSILDGTQCSKKSKIRGAMVSDGQVAELGVVFRGGENGAGLKRGQK
jgi:Holliday junction resolvase RusA-like endonuclease